MKKGYLKILIIELILLVALLFNSFVFKIAKPINIALVLLPFLIVSIFLIGYEKPTHRNKSDVLINILIFLLMYFFVTYSFGFFVGFLKNGYSLYIVDVIKNILPEIILIVVAELLRYILLTKSKGSILCIILGITVFVLVDINAMVHVYNVFEYRGLVKMICLVLFPSITKNIFLSYLTIKVGYSNAIIYRFITELNALILPIFPDYGEYINVLLKTVLPIIIMARVNNMFNYFQERKIKDSRYNNRKLVLYSVITFTLFVVVALTSGYFKYQALSIGSGSMSPKIAKGDVVIVKKLGANEVKKGDVLVYNHDGKIIVHRVAKKFYVNKKPNFITKGDNNNARDAWVVKDKQVIGIVSFKIKYIGMPTVALNELLSKK